MMLDIEKKITVTLSQEEAGTISTVLRQFLDTGGPCEMWHDDDSDFDEKEKMIMTLSRALSEFHLPF